MSFCILPWIHTYIHTNGDVYPCCHSTSKQEAVMGNVKIESIEHIVNSAKMKSLRLDMLSNKKSEVCTKCYSVEESGITSHRIHHNNYFKHIQDVGSITSIDGSIEPNIKFLDVRFSNICNLKCRTCNHELSSSIASEENRKAIMIKALPDYDIFEKHYSTIEKIYFAGGEPLLTREHAELLDKLIELGLSNNIVLDYNSNITNLSFKGNDFKDQWKKFKKVNIMASIDGVGKRGEYIRHGTNWSLIEENISILKNYVSISFALTVSILNIASIVNTHKYLVEHNIITDTNKLHIGYLVYPSHYSAKIIPDNLRNKIISEIEEYQTVVSDYHFLQQLKDLIVYLKNSRHDPVMFNKFLKESIKLDKIRNENVFESLPEYRF